MRTGCASCPPGRKGQPRGDVRFTVLKSVDVALRSRLNELLVEFLPPVFVLSEPLRLRLGMLGEPRGENRCQAADGGSGEGGNDRCVHDAITMSSERCLKPWERSTLVVRTILSKDLLASGTPGV